MRYTELTKKELQREYTKLTRRYTDFVREPLELDMTAEDTFGKSESRRAGVPLPAVGISEKQAKVNKKPAAPASLCTRYRRGWLSLFFGGNRVRNATRSAGFPGLQGVR